MSPANRWALPLAGLALVVAMGSCSPRLDKNRAAVCRSVIPAIEASDAVIRIVRSVAGHAHNSIRVDYELSAPGGVGALRHVLCRFGGDEGTPKAATLTGVETRNGPLGDAQLYFLRRFYLDAPAR